MVIGEITPSADMLTVLVVGLLNMLLFVVVVATIDPSELTVTDVEGVVSNTPFLLALKTWTEPFGCRTVFEIGVLPFAAYVVVVVTPSALTVVLSF